jgi:hypothetical protein
MTVTLPVPMECSLPPAWRSVPPHAVGAGEVAFVALHPMRSNGFTANITVSGEVRPAAVMLGQVADEALKALSATASRVRLGRREVVGSRPNAGLTQSVLMTVDLHGRPQDVGQYEVYLGMPDLRHPQRQVVLRVVLSATPDQFDGVYEDFLRFVSTIRPSGGAS